jgi:lactate dehydrogenase-like 2-hydroxyacid dehydrogenase
LKILVVSNKERALRTLPPGAVPPGARLTLLDKGAPDEALLRACGDAEALVVDAITPVSRWLIERMPNLRLIHSEGVGYEGVDLAAATERGVLVCNNKGVNAGAVAEQAVLLMLGLLRGVLAGDRAVREGRQIEAKEGAMMRGITELGDCAVGIVGLGDCGKATAARLRAFGCPLFYYSARRRDPAEEAAVGARYLPLLELAAACDIVRLHAAVNERTAGLVGREFLARMKPTAYLVNTARGELVDNGALRDALASGQIAGAGLDTVAPEPVLADNPLVDLPPEARARVLYSPHFGGITKGSIRRAQEHMWANIARLMRGERPDCVVNGL